jgi:hypothetical protein
MRRGTLTIALVVAGLASAAAATAPASLASARGTTNHGASSTSAVRYVVDKPVCPPAKPGVASCQAVAAVPAAASAPHAQRAVTAPQGFPRGPAGGYTPADLASAYGFNPSHGGTGQTIALIDAGNDPNLSADLAAFDSRYGIAAETAQSFRIVNQQGRSAPLPAADAGQAFEESIDVESARAVCRHCRLLLVEAGDADLDSLAQAAHTAIRLGATEVSNSYGGVEPKHVPRSALRQLQRLYTKRGVVVTASAGDQGWHGWDLANDGRHASGAPLLPAAVPTVIAVGGTSLRLTTTGHRAHETVWNNNGPADSRGTTDVTRATGGGCSRLYASRGWQRGVKGFRSTGCGKHRLVADVAATADPAHGFDIRDTFHSPSGQAWTTSGGTSLSAPIIAAMWALAGGAHGQPAAALSLYGHDKTDPKRSWFDVTRGGNGFCGGDTVEACLKAAHGNPHNTSLGVLDCGPTSKGRRSAHLGECRAGKGYDGPTGVGAPHGLRGFSPLRPTAKLRHSAATVHHATIFTAARLSDPFPAGRVVHATWQWGDGRAKGHGVATHHTYRHKGHFSVRLTVTDNYGVHVVRTRTITVK